MEEFLWALDYLAVGGMPKAVRTYRDTKSFEGVREVLEEIDITYTADMTEKPALFPLK